MAEVIFRRSEDGEWLHVSAPYGEPRLYPLVCEIIKARPYCAQFMAKQGFWRLSLDLHQSLAARLAADLRTDGKPRWHIVYADDRQAVPGMLECPGCQQPRYSTETAPCLGCGDTRAPAPPPAAPAHPSPAPPGWRARLAALVRADPDDGG